MEEVYQNRIDLKDLEITWGKIQPDELYLNLALNKCEMYIQQNDVLFLGNLYSDLEFSEIQTKHNVFTFFGGKGYTKLQYIEWYDRMMHVICQAHGMQHNYKVKYIIEDKLLNQR